MGYRSLSCFYGWIGSRACQCSVLVCPKKQPRENFKKNQWNFWKEKEDFGEAQETQDPVWTMQKTCCGSLLFVHDLDWSGVVWSGKKGNTYVFDS